MRSTLALLASIVLALLVPRTANAFCGFYVSGADTKLYADATQVVLMREGTKTVLSMQNDYKGPPEKFAMVVPVPTILQKDQVKTLPRAIFDKIDTLGAPRLVEFWETDPCKEPDYLTGIGRGFGNGAGLNLGSGGGSAGNLGVKVEAQFTVGEYEIVILSAKDAGGLDTWLRDEKYAIPAGAEPFFRPYVAAGMKFFVAKVDPTKIKFENGHAALSPLRFHYDSETFSLPVRLGLINSSGTQDLIVDILAKHTRYEVANYPNVTIPTNLDVSENARGRFGEFYAALFDKTVAENPKAVVTEYSWDAGSCDPCPGPTLDGDDLATLGADVIPGGTAGLTTSRSGGLAGIGAPSSPSSQPRAMPNLTNGDIVIDGAIPPEVVKRIVRQNFGRFRLCYEAEAAKNPALAGTVKTRFKISAKGEVSDVTDGKGDLANDVVGACVRRGFGNMSFPQPTQGTVAVTYAVHFAPPDPSTVPAVPFFAPTFNTTPYVLTRLHVRYGKDSLGEDLVFKTTSAIIGGREIRDAKNALEVGSKSSGTNAFQGRYVIRHPWTGAIACKEPHRDRWGGPPANDAGVAPPTPGALGAQKVAFAPRGNVPLASFLVGAAPIASATPAAEADAGDAGNTDAGPPAPAPAKGCGGCTTSSGRDVSTPSVFAMLAALLTVCVRRRRFP